MQYRTRGTCSTMINLTLDENHVIQDVSFTGGCNGNLKGISKLVIGQRAEDVIPKIEGIRCGYKNTSTRRRRDSQDRWNPLRLQEHILS